MNPEDPNVLMVEGLLVHLKDLKDQFVLVGGCATGLLMTDAARPQVRVTIDIDFVASITTKTEYYKFADELRTRGFKEDVESGVICRWQIAGFTIDIMPVESDVLGFSNLWYKTVFDTYIYCNLPSGANIKLISPPLFIATKLEAFYDRGNGDYVMSHDIEDIVTVIDGRIELMSEIKTAPQEVRDYLREEVESLLGDASFVESLAGHLSPDSANQQRLPTVIDRFRDIAEL